MSERPVKVLFVAECVTLAHMARPFTLARALEGVTDRPGYAVAFAADHRYDALFPNLPGSRESLYSIPSQQFLDALAKGTPVYDEATLARYVDDDRALLDRTRPDVVVGDFRLSLSISARLTQVPYVTISNLYWSPYARQRYPVPELPMTRLLGVGVAQVLFNLARPMVFAAHAAVLNRVRRRFGLPSLGPSLQRVYTDADLTLYADLPGMIETTPLPPAHRCIGPILWSPDVPLPAWWDGIDNGKPAIYMTPGSSGDIARLDMLVRALAPLPVTLMVAGAGRWRPGDLPDNVHLADFLPGDDAARRSALVICNGGSPTTSQAFAAGAPVLGMPQNLDQYLNMTAVESLGAGSMLRSDRLTPEGIRRGVRAILADPGYRVRAAELRQRIAAKPAQIEFADVMRHLVADRC